MSSGDITILCTQYPTYLYSANWTQINSIRVENGVWANCNV